MSADNWTDCPRCGSSYFREDYWIGFLSHTRAFSVSYSGVCLAEDSRSAGCGFAKRYEHQEPGPARKPPALPIFTSVRR